MAYGDLNIHSAVVTICLHFSCAGGFISMSKDDLTFRDLKSCADLVLNVQEKSHPLSQIWFSFCL